MKHFMDFSESHYPNGVRLFKREEKMVLVSRLKCPSLPFNFSYVIGQRADGWCFSRSRCGNDGSIRYYSHESLDEAMAHARKWAERKISEVVVA